MGHKVDSKSKLAAGAKAVIRRVAGGLSQALDPDLIREPVLRPGPHLLKEWLRDHKVVTRKKAWWFNDSEAIHPERIFKLEAKGGSVF